MAYKTFSGKPQEITRDWYVIDASQVPLGRLATAAASYLTGKGKVRYTPHVDGGDFVIVTNAAKLKVTGNKLESKRYRRHSGFPGSLKERTLKEQLKLDPTRVIYHAVRGMLPKNKLAEPRLARLKIYADNNHPHEVNKPQPLENLK